MKNISEVRSDHTDDDNYTHIDAWFTEDDGEEGKTIAIVDLDSNKVFYLDNLYRNDELVKETIWTVIRANDDEQIEVGAASMIVELEDGNITVRHGSSTKSVLHVTPNCKKGSWDKIWETIRGLESFSK